jgi:serine/threonine protein phosphatase 1
MSPDEGATWTEGRLFAIGDIHGCSIALRTLIDAIAPNPDDTIVVLGDVIDYGPDTKGAIQQLLDLSGRCRLILLTGNHEEMLFNAFSGRDDRRYWESCGGIPTRRNYPECGDDRLIDPEHREFLKKNCREYFESDRFIFVHANYYPNRPMHEQSGHTLRWESVDPHRMARHYSGKTVVVGHTTRNDGDVLDVGFLVMIDTGASMGGWLTALEVRSGEIIQTNQQGEVRRSRRSAT